MPHSFCEKQASNSDRSADGSPIRWFEINTHVWYAWRMPVHSYASRWICALAAIALIASNASAQVVNGVLLLKTGMVADVDAAVPGQTIRVALVKQHAPQWHTYWKYSGDSGLATRITWELPDGVEAGPILWPLPERYLEAGELEVYSYKGREVLVTEIRVPEDFNQPELIIRARASWLVCKEECIPGNAEHEITLPVATSSQPTNTGVFDEFEASRPSTDPPPYQITWLDTSEAISARVTGLPEGHEVDIYPSPHAGILVGHPVVGTADSAGSAEVVIPLRSGSADRIGGILVVTDPDGERSAWELPDVEGNPEDEAPVAAASAVGGPGGGGLVEFGGDGGEGIGWAMALLYGFIGGMILNLMPCVLPVISLKIFGFMKQAGEEPAKIFKLGLTFVAGIFAWFGALAILVVVLRAFGQDVNWAFQFQNPWFILGMSVLVFAFALNLFGVFEITLPGSANNQVLNLANKEGYTGTFFHGVFATILATPCTAPFMGQALGFAFAQPAPIVFAMFLAIASGMGLPFVILSAKPQWMKFLPKPGMWMEQLKQFLGFLLIATLLWLLWVLGHQGGVAAIIWAGAFLLMVGIACWIFGTFGNHSVKPTARRNAFFISTAVLALGFFLFIPGKLTLAIEAGPGTGALKNDPDGIQWIAFSNETLVDLLDGDRVIFVDFTAEWCLTCKANERIAIDVESTRAVINELDVAMVKADWTNQNEEIGEILKSFGRVGVPFYLIYPADRSQPPITLGEALRPSNVIEALRFAHGEEKLSETEMATARLGN